MIQCSLLCGVLSTASSTVLWFLVSWFPVGSYVSSPGRGEWGDLPRVRVSGRSPGSKAGGSERAAHTCPPTPEPATAPGHRLCPTAGSSKDRLMTPDCWLEDGPGSLAVRSEVAIDS